MRVARRRWCETVTVAIPRREKLNAIPGRLDSTGVMVAIQRPSLQKAQTRRVGDGEAVRGQTYLVGRDGTDLELGMFCSLDSWR